MVTPDIEKVPLAKNSKTRYALSLKHLLGECVGHEHMSSLKRKTIRAGTQYLAMENCLLEIAELHGAESARQARSVLSGYVLKSLQRNHLVVGNILRGERIDLKSNAIVRESGKQGGVALNRDEYNAVVEYLLAIDPAEGVEKPKRGRWTLEDAIAKRRNAIDITLLQAGTGLRISEARQAWCGLLVDSGDGLHIEVVREITKGGYERVAHVLDQRVVERLRDRLAHAQSSSDLIVGSPFDAAKVWDLRNCSKVLEGLYLEMADTLKIEAFKAERSHIWRATLNTMLIDVVPHAMRAAQFGHTEKVNMKSYTDKALTSEMVAASRQALVAYR